MNQSVTESSKKDGRDGFPIGMRVLAVDDDKVCLKLLEGLLLECGYKVTVTQHALTALQLLRENKDNYDLVISDVKMPDVDGFKLLEIVGLEMDLPVIMLSVDSEVNTVMKGIMHGACDYLVKPVRLEELKIIWKHVVRKSLHDTEEANDNIDKINHVTKSEEDHTSKLTRKCKDKKKEKDDETNDFSDEDLSAQKRPRVAWSSELHSKFINAVNQFGLNRAFPKRILDFMNVPGLTRENVASHLQKYRKALKKNSIEASQQYHGGVGSSGFGPNTPSSVLLSFSNQSPNINSLEGVRVEGYQNHHKTIPFGHAQQSQYRLTHMTSPWLPLSLNLQNNLCQQYTSTTQASQLRTQHFGYASNPLAMETLAPQSTFKHASYRSLTPIPNQPSGYMENPCQNCWASDTNSGSSSVPQPRYVPTQQSIDTLFDNTNLQQTDLKDSISAELDVILPMQHQQYQFNARTGADLELGAQINGDSTNLQSSEQEQSMGIGSPELVTHPLEPSSAETIFHLSNSDSADDLHTVLKQFQQ